MLPLKTVTTEACHQASHNSKVMSLFNWKAWHPKQHCNRCLNHFFPTYSGNPFKGSHISLLHQLQMGTFGFLLIYFLTFLSKVSRFFPFSAPVADLLRHMRRHWQHDLGSSLVYSKHPESKVQLCIFVSLQRKLQAPFKVRTSSWRCLTAYSKMLEKILTLNTNFVTPNWHQNPSNMLYKSR